MQTVTSTEVQNKFGEYLEIARDEAVKITRNGRVKAVIISADDYKTFQALENAYWLERGLQGRKEASLPPGESVARVMKRLAELDDAES